MPCQLWLFQNCELTELPFRNKLIMLSHLVIRVIFSLVFRNRNLPPKKNLILSAVWLRRLSDLMTDKRTRSRRNSKPLRFWRRGFELFYLILFTIAERRDFFLDAFPFLIVLPLAALSKTLKTSERTTSASFLLPEATSFFNS